MDVRSDSDECLQDFIDVYEYPEGSSPSRIKYVCDQTDRDELIFRSDSNEFYMAFLANSDGDNGHGFTLEIEAVPDDGKYKHVLSSHVEIH